MRTEHSEWGGGERMQDRAPSEQECCRENSEAGVPWAEDAGAEKELHPKREMHAGKG